MRTETRKEFEKIRAIRDDYNKQLKYYEKLAETDKQRVIDKLNDILDKLETTQTSVIHDLKSIPLDMLDIDDIIETYVWQLEIGDNMREAIQMTIKKLNRGLIG